MRGVNPGPRGADTALVQPPGPLKGQHPDIGPPRPLLAGGLNGVTTSATPMLYVDCDVPDGMTLAEWRRHRHEEDAPRRSARRTVRRIARRLGA